VSSRLSLYSIRELGLSSEQASRFVTGFFLGLLSGRVFATFVPFPGGHVRQLFVSLSLSFITQVLGLTWSPWFFVLTGLSMSVFYPICGAYIASLFPGQEGTLFSWAMAAQSLLIVVMHVGIGAITDLWGIQMAFYFGLMFLGLSGLSLWRSEVERNKCKTL